MKYWTKNTVYIFLFAGSLLGIAFVMLTGHYKTTGNSPLWVGCVFKAITDLPCPSCGSTRTVLELIQGDVAAIISGNPLGIILLPAIFVLPLWVAFDFIIERSGLFNFVNRTISYLKSNHIASTILVILIVLNWMWNIIKGL